MAYLELSPAIAALRARPEEFEFSNDTLHHLGSRHRFRFLSEDSVAIHADCGCSILKASKEQTKVFHAAYREWHASYWRPLEINREFASHFEPARGALLHVACRCPDIGTFRSPHPVERSNRVFLGFAY
jgi:hypothetical protein